MVSTALLVIIYLSFISLGLPDSLLGGAWPSMMGDIGASASAAGPVQMTVSFCTIISSLNAARLIRRFGTGRLTACSVAMTAAALMGFSITKNYWWLFVVALPMGLGAGAVDSALNNYVALHCQARHMNWLHCFWGVGATTGPLILSACLSLGAGWQGGYRTIGFLQIALCIALFATLGLWTHSGVSDEEENARVLTVGQVLALPGAKAGMICFLCYCAVESSLGLWAATFMVMARGMDAAQAARIASMFYFGIMIGRGAGGFIAAKLLPKQMVRLGLAILIVGCALLAVPAAPVSVLGLMLCGLGCAPIYPNIIQDTPVNYGAENSQAAVGVQMAFAYVGSTFVPSVFGAVAGVVGYETLAVFALLVTALMAVMFTAQKKIVENKK